MGYLCNCWIAAFCLTFVKRDMIYVSGQHELKQEPLGGPNVCHPDSSDSPCCDGWIQTFRHGPCVKPLCNPPCRRGICIEPNMCLCHGGIRASQCPHTGRIPYRVQQQQPGRKCFNNGRCGLVDILQMPNTNCQSSDCSVNHCTGSQCQSHTNRFLSYDSSTVNGHSALIRRGNSVNGYRPEISYDRDRPVSDQRSNFFLNRRGSETQQFSGHRRYHQRRATAKDPDRVLHSPVNTARHTKLNGAIYGGNTNEDMALQPIRREPSLLVNPYDERNIYDYIGNNNRALPNAQNRQQLRPRLYNKFGYFRRYTDTHRFLNDQPKKDVSIDTNLHAPSEGYVKHLPNRIYRIQGSKLCGYGNCDSNQGTTTNIHKYNQQRHRCRRRRCSLLHRLTEIQSSPCIGGSKCVNGIEMQKTIRRRKTCVLPFCDIRNPSHDQKSIISSSTDCRNCNTGNCVAGLCLDNYNIMCDSPGCRQPAGPTFIPKGMCESGQCGEDTVVIDKPCKDDEVFVEDENGFRTCQPMDEFIQKTME